MLYPPNVEVDSTAGNWRMLVWKECRVCASEFTVHLEDVHLQRQDIFVPQHFCMTCNSLFHTSNYEEDPKAFANDTAWLLANPMPEAETLVQTLADDGARRVFEAGCGTGDLLLAFGDHGLAAEGVDPNVLAVEEARKRGAKATVGLFQQLSEPVDAILAVDVMEHLPDPRSFFRSLVDSVVEGGLIVVRVPEVDQNQWGYLKGANSVRDAVECGPFNDNSAHITHFSSRGLRMMAESLGAAYLRPLIAHCHLYRRA